MEYKCSVCDKSVEGDLITFTEHTEDHIVDVIKAKHPQWVGEDGICIKCLEFYKAQLKGEDF